MRLIVRDEPELRPDEPPILDISDPSPEDITAALSPSEPIPPGRVFELSGGPAGTITAVCLQGEDRSSGGQPTFELTIRNGVLIAPAWPSKRVRHVFLATWIDNRNAAE